MRETLSALQILGIIESRPGDGTYVRGSVSDGLDLGEALYVAKAGEDLLEIWEARREIEKSLTKLAINRATPKDLDAIESLLDEMRKPIHAEDSAGYLSANTKFHLAIATAANNLPLKNALRALMEIATQQLLEEINLGYVLESIEKFSDEEAGTNAIENQLYGIGEVFNMRVYYERRRYESEEVCFYQN